MPAYADPVIRPVNHFDGCRNNCLLPFCGDGIGDRAKSHRDKA